ncbi:MAG: PH domain-containing protein [Lacipirellulaceae bacterium]
MADNSDPASAAGPSPTAKDRFERAAAAKQGRPDTPENELWVGSYSPKAMLGTWVAGGGATIAAIVVGLLASFSGNAWGILTALVLVMWVAMAAVYWYRRLSVHYRLTNQRFVHERGLLWRTVDRVELIDVDDVTYRQGPVERALGVGTIMMASSDRTSPELRLAGIDDVRKVADLIDDARRKERRSRGLHIESV